MQVWLRHLGGKLHAYQLLILLLAVTSAAQTQSSDVKQYLAFIDHMMKGFRTYQYDAVIAECSEMIRLHPRFAEAFYFRGQAYELKGDDARALPDFNHAIEFGQDYAEAFFSRSTIYARQGQDDKAIEDATRALHGTPLIKAAFHPAEALLVRGRTYYHKRDYDRAIQDLSEAIRVEPKDALIYQVFYYRGQARQAKKDHSHAAEDFKKSLELKPDFDEARLALEAATSAQKVR
jgi:tetratricopeptide (TPR) repeat protein